MTSGMHFAVYTSQPLACYIQMLCALFYRAEGVDLRRWMLWHEYRMYGGATRHSEKNDMRQVRMRGQPGFATRCF